MKRILLSVAMVAGLGSLAIAQTPSPQYSPLPSPQSQPRPAPKPTNEAPKPQDIISALSTDINGDYTLDRILLSQTDEGDATLWVYLGKDSPNGGLAFHPPIIAKAIVFGGTAFGQWPSLEMNKQGTSLLVRSQNQSIGRNHWNQTLTITWRNNTLVIAGLTYQWNDLIDLKQSGSCDVNFLSGLAIRNGKPHPDKVQPLTLAQFDPEKMPAACTW